MPANVTHEVLEIAATLRAENLIAGTKKAEKEASKRFGLIRKAVESLSKPLDVVGKNAVRSLRRWKDEQVATYKANQRLYKISDDMARDLLAKHKKLATASKAETEQIQKEIESLEEKYKVQMKNMDAAAKARQLVRGAVGRKKEEREESGKKAFEEFASYDFADAGKDMAEGFADAVGALRSKDFGGLVKGIAGGVGSGLKGLGAKATRMASAGAESKGLMGTAFKALAPLLKGIGPLFNTLAKLGPMIGAVASTVVGLVKLMLDAEAAAKEINKEILASASSADIFNRNMRDVGAATGDLGATLGRIRDAATSLDNLRWGISKETHTAVIGALTAEGVSLGKIEKNFEGVSRASQEATGHAKDWGSMVQMSVAYSRAFGVSLTDITTMQGEMMSEMGMNLTGVQASFQYMLQGAEQAGIASNKFFGIIRGVTADMSLFNLRMQDSVKLLSQVGKVMSPRNAQKFMQTITGFTKGMGLMDRTKSVLLGGGAKKVGGALQGDLLQRIDGLATDLGGTVGDELRTIFRDPKLSPTKRQEKLTKFMAAHQDKLDGAQREAILDAARMQSKLTKGGLVDVASALKDAGPFAIIDHLDRIGQTLFRKPIDQLTDVERLAAEQAAGISEEMQDQMAKQKQGVEQMKADLAQKIKDGSYLTEEETKLVAKLNEQGKKTAEDIENMNARDLWNMMSADQKKELESGKKQIDFQEQIAGYQSSALDKLGVIMDWIMNQIYNVMVGIWEEVADLAHLSDKTEKYKAQVAKTGNKELMEAVAKAGSEDELKRALQQSSPAKEIERILGAEGQKERKELADKLADLKAKQAAAPEAGKASYDKQIEAAQREVDAAKKKAADAQAARTHAQSAPDNAAIMADAYAQFAKKHKVQSAEDKKKEEEKRKAEAERKKAEGTPPPAQGDTAKKAGPSTLSNQPPKPPAQAQASAKSASPGTGTGTAAPPSPGQAAKAVQAGAAKMDADAQTKQVLQQQAKQQGLSEEQAEALSEQGSTLADIYKALRVKGVRMDWKYRHNDYEGLVEKGVLEGSREALFEYFMYSKLKQEEVADALKRGVKPKDIATGMVEAGKKGLSGSEALKSITATANAEGGIPLKPAPGEVLASIKPLSEAIVPLNKLGGGGGGAVVELRTTGDLARFVDARVIDGNVKFNKNAKTR